MPSIRPGAFLARVSSLADGTVVHARQSHSADKESTTMTTTTATTTRKSSGLTRIDDTADDPVDLFGSWREAAIRERPHAPVNACLATVSRDYKVGARNIILREFEKSGFVFVTDNRSRKANDLENVPNAAMCFYWNYMDDNNERVFKQVRVEGLMKKLEKSEYQHLYDSDPLYAKIRAHVCHQDETVEWEDLKRRHDQLLEDVENGTKDLPMPDHYVGYKLQPLMMDFYFARPNEIADRMRYWRNDLASPWQRHRVAA